MNRNCKFQAINREEELFKWEQTTYPAIDIISNDLEPYQTLFNNIARWQKQNKRWMDGEFTTLNSEAISSELDELFS